MRLIEANLHVEHSSDAYVLGLRVRIWHDAQMIILYSIEENLRRRYSCTILEMVSFEMWCWRRMEKISWTDHVRNEEVSESMSRGISYMK